MNIDIFGYNPMGKPKRRKYIFRMRPMFYACVHEMSYACTMLNRNILKGIIWNGISGKKKWKSYNST